MQSRPLPSAQLTRDQAIPPSLPTDKTSLRPWRTPTIERLLLVETRGKRALPGALGFASFPSP